MASRGRPVNTAVQAKIDQLKRMRIGHSFFIEGAARAEFEFLRKPALNQGIGIAIKQVSLDEIYQMPGVRIWRKEGTYDQL